MIMIASDSHQSQRSHSAVSSSCVNEYVRTSGGAEDLKAITMTNFRRHRRSCDSAASEAMLSTPDVASVAKRSAYFNIEHATHV